MFYSVLNLQFQVSYDHPFINTTNKDLPSPLKALKLCSRSKYPVQVAKFSYENSVYSLYGHITMSNQPNK